MTSKGQTTIPEKIRKALRIKPGDKLEYAVEGDRATIRVRPGIRSLKDKDMTKTMGIRMDRENYEFLNELTEEQRSDLSKAVRDWSPGTEFC